MSRLLPFLLIACLALPGGLSAQDKKSRKRAPHPVETAQVELQQHRISQQASGSLRLRRVLRVYTEEEGRITALPHYEGDAVKKGDRLLALDDRVLRAELTKARANEAQARADLKRLEGLNQRKLAAEEALTRAQTALEVARAETRILQTRLGNTRRSAPFDGIVSARLAEPGDVLSRYSHALTLVDPESLIAELRVSELMLPQLAVGDAVSVRIDALGSERHAGHIQRIHPALDERTRQGIVEIAFQPIPAGARSGQFCRADLAGREQSRLAIPLRALRQDADGEFVYRITDGKAERVSVESGVQLGEAIEILSGIASGDAVVTRGFLGLKPGRAVAAR